MRAARGIEFDVTCHLTLVYPLKSGRFAFHSPGYPEFSCWHYSPWRRRKNYCRGGYPHKSRASLLRRTCAQAERPLNFPNFGFTSFFGKFQPDRHGSNWIFSWKCALRRRVQPKPKGGLWGGDLPGRSRAAPGAFLTRPLPRGSWSLRQEGGRALRGGGPAAVRRCRLNRDMHRT